MTLSEITLSLYQQVQAPLTAVVKHPHCSCEASCIVCLIRLKLDCESVRSVGHKLPDLIQCGAKFVWHSIVCVHCDKVIDTTTCCRLLQINGQDHKGNVVFRDVNLPDNFLVFGVSWFISCPISFIDPQVVVWAITEGLQVCLHPVVSGILDATIGKCLPEGGGRGGNKWGSSENKSPAPSR